MRWWVMKLGVLNYGFSNDKIVGEDSQTFKRAGFQWVDHLFGVLLFLMWRFCGLIWGLSFTMPSRGTGSLWVGYHGFRGKKI